MVRPAVLPRISTKAIFSDMCDVVSCSGSFLNTLNIGNSCVLLEESPKIAKAFDNFISKRKAGIFSSIIFDSESKKVEAKNLVKIIISILKLTSVFYPVFFNVKVCCLALKIVVLALETLEFALNFKKLRKAVNGRMGILGMALAVVIPALLYFLSKVFSQKQAIFKYFAAYFIGISVALTKSPLLQTFKGVIALVEQSFSVASSIIAKERRPSEFDHVCTGEKALIEVFLTIFKPFGAGK